MAIVDLESFFEGRYKKELFEEGIGIRPSKSMPTDPIRTET